MRQFKWPLMVGGIIALTSQLYVNFFIDSFRISFAVVLFPILLMTLAKDQNVIKVGLVTGFMVFILRMILNSAGVSPAPVGQWFILVNGLFYVFYSVFFSLMVKNRYTVSLPRLALSILICDFSSNLCEMGLQIKVQYNLLTPKIYLDLLVVALLRTLVAGAILIWEQSYCALIKHRDHENRYQRLYLMVTQLKSEIYFMEKNTDEIESAMNNAYMLYENLSEIDTEPDLKKMALSIALDVHEIKKDYISIMQGIRKEINEQNDNNPIKLHDLLHILKESTNRMLENKGLDIQVDIHIQDNFIVDQHYTLMMILINLTNNAIEAIEEIRTNGRVQIDESKQGDSYIFTVSDNGPGISDKDMNHIFQMGFSTKFDELSGDIYRGVGLPGVKMAVEEKFHGMIEVDSQQGVGTKFQVKIPKDILEGV